MGENQNVLIYMQIQPKIDCQRRFLRDSHVPEGYFHDVTEKTSGALFPSHMSSQCE